MLPLWVFRHRVILPAILTALVVGVLLIGLTSYIPLYGQSVLGHSALDAPSLVELRDRSDEEWRAALKGSPMKRAKIAGLRRNIEVALRNSGLL